MLLYSQDKKMPLLETMSKINSAFLLTGILNGRNAT